MTEKKEQGAGFRPRGSMVLIREVDETVESAIIGGKGVEKVTHYLHAVGNGATFALEADNIKIGDAVMFTNHVQWQKFKPGEKPAKGEPQINWAICDVSEIIGVFID